MDNESSDETKEIIEEYSPKFAARGIDFKFFSEKDEGLYDAVNKGIARADGEIVSYLCVDDEYTQDSFNIVVEQYKKRPFDYMFSNIIVENELGKQMLKKANRNTISARGWNQVSVFARREVMIKEPFKNYNMHCDYEQYLRIREKGYRIITSNRILAKFHFGGMSNSGNWRDLIKRYKMKKRIWDEHELPYWIYVEGLLIEIAKMIYSKMWGKEFKQ